MDESPARRQAVEAMVRLAEGRSDDDARFGEVDPDVAAELLDALSVPLLSRLFMETANTGCVHRYLPGEDRCQCGASEWTGVGA